MLLTTFPRYVDFESSVKILQALGISYRVIDPAPGYRLVGTPSLVVGDGALLRLDCEAAREFYCSGWVEFHQPVHAVPAEEPERFPEDRVGELAIMVLAPCVADPVKLRLIAHVSGDLSPVFPYLNAEMKSAVYNASGQTLLLMEGYRMVSLFPSRIAVAKADDIVDAWRVLENIRRLVNRCWQRRSTLTPCYELRRRPPALEIYKRLPGTNCGACGEQTCMSFALRLWNGEVRVNRCSAVFDGAYGHLKEALLQVCAGMGAMTDEQADESKAD